MWGAIKIKANGVLRRPLQKIAAQQLEYCTGQIKIAAQKSGYRAGLFKNCGTAIGVLRWPLQKIAARQSEYRAGLFKKIAARQSGIAPAS
jgi:hypothetical protein